MIAFPLPLTACLALAFSACGYDAPTGTAPGYEAPAAPTVSAAPLSSRAAGPYRFDEPVARFTLPASLVEISALTVLDERHLGAVQDEDGVLYVLSVETGRVAAAVPFGPPGDYEGLEAVGARLFVLRADGAVLELENWSGGGPIRTAVYETGLGAKDCDAEGLGADGERLLIACKEEVDGPLGHASAVYAFDLDRMALAAEPAFVLRRGDVPGGGKKLRPSALAVHPVTGHTVVLSSKREALVSLGSGGTVEGVWDLSPAAFEQPEGLAFLPGGDAFVSSEGRGGPAVLLRFAYQPAGR